MAVGSYFGSYFISFHLIKSISWTPDTTITTSPYHHHSNHQRCVFLAPPNIFVACPRQPSRTLNIIVPIVPILSTDFCVAISSPNCPLKSSSIPTPFLIGQRAFSTRPRLFCAISAQKPLTDQHANPPKLPRRSPSPLLQGPTQSQLLCC